MTKEHEDTFAARLTELLKESGETTGQFTKRLGTKGSNIYSILDPDKQQMPTLPLLTKILDAFPHIAYRWMISGDGKKLRDDNIYNTIVDVPKSPSDFGDILESLEELIPERHAERYNVLSKSLFKGILKLHGAYMEAKGIDY